MTDTTDNVIPLQQPGMAQEPRTTPRRKDPRAAARKAKSRSKIKSDRDTRPTEDVPPLPAAAPSTAPTVTQPSVPRPPAERRGTAVDLTALTAAVAPPGRAPHRSVQATFASL